MLQNYVKSEKKKAHSLLLDCKEIRNSLETMLERFYSLKNSLQKALIELKHQTCLDDSDFSTEIVNVLKPIHLTVEALCHRDPNLVTTESTLKILLRDFLEKKIQIRL